MKRNLLFVGILALVAFFVWSAGKVPLLPRTVPTSTETPGLPALCNTCALATQAALMQDKINLSFQQIQSIAAATARSADGMQVAIITPYPGVVNALATINAADVTRSTVWAQVVIITPYPGVVNALATTNAADVTRSAVQAEADRQQARLQLTPPAATQNAAVQQTGGEMFSGVATAIARTSLQAQSDITQKPELGAVLWMWLTPIFMLVAAVLTLWGVTRGLAQWRTGSQPTAPR